MKRKWIILVCLLVTLCNSISVNAQESLNKVGEGYTAEGVYYEVFLAEEMENSDISLCGTSVNVTREVRYYGIIIPQKELSWGETINGIYYSGILRLRQFTYTTTDTIATYEGVLYEE